MEDTIIEKEHEEVITKPKHHHAKDKYTPPPQQPESSNVNLNDFLNPRSMITPGVAGSLVMLIANTLWVQFMVPQKMDCINIKFCLNHSDTHQILFFAI